MIHKQSNQYPGGRLIAKLCHTSDCCPEVIWRDVLPGGMALEVRDDWGYVASFPADAPPNADSFEEASWYQLIIHGIPQDDTAGKGEYVKLVGAIGIAFMTEAQRDILLDQIEELVAEQMALAGQVQPD